MSDVERRAKYRYAGVLIETARILSPQFDDAVVYLTGAQIELLRNVSHYLNRRNTYVSEYQPDYYLWPTDEDYDDILEIVADLEETLMGNPNTIWGFQDIYIESPTETSVGAGTTVVEGSPVPEDEIWIVTNAVLRHSDDTSRVAGLEVFHNAMGHILEASLALAPWELLKWQNLLWLAEADYIKGYVTALANDKVAYLSILGYKMNV